MSFVLLLFVPLLKQDFIGYEFFQKNKVFLIGVISFFLINHIDFLLKSRIYLGVLGTFGLITLYTIMIICLFTLYLKRNAITNEDQESERDYQN